MPFSDVKAPRASSRTRRGYSQRQPQTGTGRKASVSWLVRCLPGTTPQSPCTFACARISRSSLSIVLSCGAIGLFISVPPLSACLLGCLPVSVVPSCLFVGAHLCVALRLSSSVHPFLFLPSFFFSFLPASLHLNAPLCLPACLSLHLPTVLPSRPACLPSGTLCPHPDLHPLFTLMAILPRPVRVFPTLPSCAPTLTVAPFVSSATCSGTAWLGCLAWAAPSPLGTGTRSL